MGTLIGVAVGLAVGFFVGRFTKLFKGKVTIPGFPENAKDKAHLN